MLDMRPHNRCLDSSFDAQACLWKAAWLQYVRQSYRLVPLPDLSSLLRSVLQADLARASLGMAATLYAVLTLLVFE